MVGLIFIPYCSVYDLNWHCAYMLEHLACECVCVVGGGVGVCALRDNMHMQILNEWPVKYVDITANLKSNTSWFLCIDHYKLEYLRVLEWYFAATVTGLGATKHAVANKYPQSSLKGMLTCNSHSCTVFYGTQVVSQSGGIWMWTHCRCTLRKFSCPTAFL